MPRFDVNPDAELDWTSFLAKKRKELERLHNVYMSLLSNANVDVSEMSLGEVDGHTSVSMQGFGWLFGTRTCTNARELCALRVCLS